jgi:hypothetical protein
MADKVFVDHVISLERGRNETEPSKHSETRDAPQVELGRSARGSMRTYKSLGFAVGVEEPSNDASRDQINDTTVPQFWSARNFRHRRSCSTVENSPSISRSSSPRPTLASSATTPSVYTVETFTHISAAPKHPSLFRRLRSSISSGSTSKISAHRPSVEPSDFLTPPETPEKRFVDAIGIVCPGVSDRVQCDHHLAHFVSTFRLCQPIEYTTALADHGLTYTDYCHLLVALSDFLKKHSIERRIKISQKKHTNIGKTQKSTVKLQERVAVCQNHRGSTFLDTTEQFEKAKQQANILNELLENITTNLRARGLPIMVCVSSFSLFAPHRISETHMQILHVPFAPQHRPVRSRTETRCGQRLSFIDPFALIMTETRSVSKSRPQLAGRSQSDATPYEKASQCPHQAFQNDDRSLPWPLWPNIIPSCKKQMMNEQLDRYGADPYSRAWIRASISTRTKSSTYTKYMIEQENDPFVNRRLEYEDHSNRRTTIQALLINASRAWRDQFSSEVNRVKYEHNRRLECRKTVEQGSRLRMLRFGFRHAIHPPHTPEMEELGLSKDRYQTILSTIADIRSSVQLCTKCPISYLLSSVNRIRRRSTEDALVKVSEYIRELNAAQRRVVWTIEKIPGVYDRGFGRGRTEWEISAWNGEDPLELLFELERWGIIEQRMNIDEAD